MVHALTEAHRVLAPRGHVIEYRPERDPAGRRRKTLPLNCRRGSHEIYAGDLVETDEYYPDYAAAGQALRRILARGLFELQSSQTIYLLTHVRTAPILDRLLAQEWTGTTIGAQLHRRAEDLLRRYPGSHLVVKDFYVVNVLRKLERHRPVTRATRQPQSGTS